MDDRKTRLPRDANNWPKCDPTSVVINAADLGEFCKVIFTTLGEEKDKTAVIWDATEDSESVDSLMLLEGADPELSFARIDELEIQNDI